MLSTGRRRSAATGLGLILGLGLLLSVAALAWTSLDERPNGVELSPMIALVTLVIPTFAIITAEFRIVAKIVGVDLPLPFAARVTVIGTVANTLPLPGAALTRAYALNRRGASTASTGQALVATAGLWLGLSLLATALGLASQRAGAAALFALAGVGGGTVSLAILWRLGASIRNLGALVFIEALLTLTGAVRIWLAFSALSLDGSALEIAALTAATPASSAVAIVPAGLGVREALAAGLGSLSGIGAASSGLATAFDRAVGLAVLVPIGVAVARWNRKHSA